MASDAQALPRFEIRPLSEDEGGGYLIEFPDFPGCIADGETPEEAMREGRDALASYVRTLEDLGRPIPRPGEEASTKSCGVRLMRRFPRGRAV